MSSLLAIIAGLRSWETELRRAERSEVEICIGVSRLTLFVRACENRMDRFQQAIILNT